MRRLAALALAVGSAVAAHAASGQAAHRVLGEDRQEVRLEATFPAPALRAALDGAPEVVVPGAPSPRAPGRPDLPEYTVLLAVPRGTVPRLVTDAVEETPAPLGEPPRVWSRDPESGRPVRRALRADDPVAAEAVSVEALGIVRHTALARVTFRPVRYDPATRGWTATRRARVRVAFEPSAGAPPAALDALAEDPLDAALAGVVANPSAAELARGEGGRSGSAEATTASIPEPEPSLMDALKVRVRADGLYRITRTDLTGAGVDPSGIDPRTFVLTHRGVEVPIEVTGEADGVFDSGDVIRFYGRALGGIETWDNVYRLTGGVRPGLRMAARDAAPSAGTPVPATFRNRAFQETDFLYWASPPDEVPDAWYWDRVATATAGVPVTVDKTVTVTNVSTAAGTARLEVRVQSRRETPGPSPNHHARIYLNGNLVDDRTWTGLLGQTLAADVPQDWVLEGANTVRLENPSDLGLTTQEEWLDTITLLYQDRYVAESNSLEFRADAAGPWQFEVTGFTGSDMVAYDVSDPSAPVRLTGIQARQDGTSWTAAFSDPVADPAAARFVALRPGGAKAPSGFVEDAPSGLRAQAAAGADLLIVSYDGFDAAVQPLADLRRGQGLRVVTAKLTDVYDEFNGGIAEVAGIRNFVEWAFVNYAPPAPTYLLLVGDGTYDPKDYKANGDNYVPVRLERFPDFGESASETWYGAVSGGDALPDLAVGRISARSASDVTTQVNNIVAYETSPPVADLNSGLLYVADDDDGSFETILEDLVSRFHPPAVGVRRVYLNDYPQTQAGVDAAKADMKAGLNAGSLVTTYMGHGARTFWAAENLWTNADVGTLSSTGRLTFATALNCTSGYFHNIDAEPWSLGEQWNRVSSRGAVANWAPSATGNLFSYDKMSDELFRHLFELREQRLGEASWRALLDAHLVHNVGLDYVREMVFFGDPSTRLPLDSDRDGILDAAETAAGADPDDADTDDDGVLDGAEVSWSADTDGDGLVNARDPDADDDGLPDGLERGVTAPPASTDVARGNFTADADPATTTDPLLRDTDGGGAPDGAEDRDADGAVDAGETDPRVGADDPACSAAVPPEIAGLQVARQGGDVLLTWPAAADACALYRVSVAPSVRPLPADFVDRRVTTLPSSTDVGAVAAGDRAYRVRAVNAAGQAGP